MLMGGFAGGGAARAPAPIPVLIAKTWRIVKSRRMGKAECSFMCDSLKRCGVGSCVVRPQRKVHFACRGL